MPSSLALKWLDGEGEWVGKVVNSDLCRKEILNDVSYTDTTTEGKVWS